jgi:hypothetical protein
MKLPHLQWRKESRALLATEQGRQCLVTAALQLTEGTTLAPGAYEQLLLGQFVSGELTIDQVVESLEAPAP